MTRCYVYTGTGHALDEDAARDYIRDGYLLSPRTVLNGCTKLPSVPMAGISIDPNNIHQDTQKALEAAIGPVAGTCRAIMFSGGFDSLLIALLAKQCGAKITAVTLGFEDFNPMTVQGAVESAERMKLDHRVLYVNAVEFLSAFEALSGITDEPVLDLDLAVVYAALKKYDGQGGDVFISGMGSDQWFGNEALLKTPAVQVRLDWAAVAQAAHQKAAEAFGLKFIFPFLSDPLIALSQSIPDAMKKDKELLRTLSVIHAIPHRSTAREIQVPDVIRHILIKTYGHRAWPSPIPTGSRADHQALRQIVLGLWLEKAKERMMQKSAKSNPS